MGLPDRCKGALKKITTRCCESCFAVGNPTTGLRGSPLPITPVLVVRSPFCKGPNPLKGDGFRIFLLKDFLLGEKNKPQPPLKKVTPIIGLWEHTHTHTPKTYCKSNGKAAEFEGEEKTTQSGNQTHQKNMFEGL